MPDRELSRRAQRAAVIIWCSFLAAAVATTIAFALFDPQSAVTGEPPPWWTTRLAVYAIGFFFFWGVAAVASALTLYMISTAHRDG